MENKTNIELGLSYAVVLEVERVDPEQERTRLKKNLFLGYLERSRGMISVTCQKVGIGRSTYYHWRKFDKEFRDAVDELINEKPDILEDRLFSVAMEGNVPALKYFLSHRHPIYKKQQQGKESKVHIYHHVDRGAGSGNITLEDLIDDPELFDIYIESQKRKEIEAKKEEAKNKKK